MATTKTRVIPVSVAVAVGVLILFIIACVGAKVRLLLESDYPSYDVALSSMGGGMDGSMAIPMEADDYGSREYAMKAGSLADSTFAPEPPYYGTAGATAAETDARIIKTGSMYLEVESTRETARKVEEIASLQGGFVDSSSVVENTDGTVTGYVTIRVENQNFSAAMDSLRALGIRVLSESSNAQDVTEQYTDLEAQLTAAQAEEAQYLVILTKANDVEDILAVQQYLSSVRYRIESLQGQMKYLENRTEYSTISVTISEEAHVALPVGKFDLGRDAREAIHTVILIFQSLASFLVWFVIVGGIIAIPVAIIVAIIIAVIKRILKK